jgi:hypothetical protein
MAAKEGAMTEAEWLACNEPMAMLELVTSEASKRKLRLFVADGVNALASIFGKDEEVLAEMHERVAEGQATEEDLERYLLRNMPELWEHRAPSGNLPSVWETARMLVRDRYKLAPQYRGDVPRPESRAAENAAMCRVLREIFGNPFRPVALDPAWLQWNGGTVRKMAQAIYDDRAFDRLPILADALEEASCTNRDLLDHCRGGGDHVRGCWAVDLLLGKE